MHFFPEVTGDSVRPYLTQVGATGYVIARAPAFLSTNSAFVTLALGPNKPVAQ